MNEPSTDTTHTTVTGRISIKAWNEELGTTLISRIFCSAAQAGAVAYRWEDTSAARQTLYTLAEYMDTYGIDSTIAREIIAANEEKWIQPAPQAKIDFELSIQTIITQSTYVDLV